METNKTLNLCEKLAECPEGTKLWSPLFGECEFLGLSRDLDEEPEDNKFWVHNDEMGRVTFDSEGRFFSSSEECLIFPSGESRDWDTWVNPKARVERFDPKTLKPFDRILVRDAGDEPWRPEFFSRLDDVETPLPVVVIGSGERWAQAIPYNDDTMALVRSEHIAPEFYRWWEDAR